MEKIIKKDKVNQIINIIKEMEEKDKIRLAIRLSESNYTPIEYDREKTLEKFDNLLKEKDEEYRTTIINFNKYPIINLTMAKMMEMDIQEQNQIALFLFNNIKF